MTIYSEIRLGPLTQAMCKDASWCHIDHVFPSDQVWADEIEKVLSFLEIKGQFDRYLPSLRGKLTQRDGAIAEARVAFFFHRNGFSIISWEPKGEKNRFGEFEIIWPNTKPIFVEVKGPRWEGELNDEELIGHRRKEPKYPHGEARSVQPVEKVIVAAEKAIPKFLPDKSNLLVVVGYLLFLSPKDLPKNIVEPQLISALSDERFSRIGGIIIFDTQYNYKSKLIEYQTIFINNPNVLPLCAIPLPVAQGLLSANKKGFWR